MALNESSVIYWPSVCGNTSEKDAFWNDAVSIYTQSPDFTRCFQNTVLVWVPCAIFLFFAFFYFLSLKSRPSIDNGTSCLNSIKLILGSLLSLVTFLDFIIPWIGFSEPGVQTDYFIKSGLLCVTMVVATILTRYEYKRGVASGGLLINLWLMLVILGIVEFRSSIINFDSETIPYFNYLWNICTFYIYYACIASLLILSLWSDESALGLAKSKSKVNKAEEERPLLSDSSEKTESKEEPEYKLCPEVTAPFWSRVLFLWITKMIFRGYRKTLSFDDLWGLNEDDKCRRVVPTFEKAWEEEVKKANHVMIKKANTGKYQQLKNATPSVEVQQGSKKQKGPSFWRTVVKSIGGYFMVGGVYKLVYDVISFVNPQILDLLITFISSGNIYAWQGYLYAGLLFVVAMLRTVILQQYWHVCFIVGMRLRTAVTGVVYRKAMRLSSSARKGATVGEIVNLMSVDAQKLQDAPGYLHMIWSTPLTIALAMYFLWMQLGPSVLAGLALMLLLVPINGYVAQKTRALQVQQMKFKDGRLKLMNEVLNGIKVLKLYAWEESFKQRILDIRDDELRVLKKAAYLSACSALSWFMAPYLTALCTFAVYMLLDSNHTLTANKTFVSLSLFNILQVPASVLPAVIAIAVQVALGSFAVYTTISPDNVLDANKAFVSLSLFNLINYPVSILPAVISFGVQGAVSIGRITKFLKNEELDPDNVGDNPSPGTSVEVKEGTFSWGPDEDPTLKRLNLKVKEGELVGVVGTVGSGKSSLISSILGEMQVMDGSVDVRGSIAFVPQQAWIQNATLKNNIYFGQSVKPSKYQQVIEACALGPDLKILPGGDETEIGEKGINLSGGQKQRVSLARAVYQNSDIYLLDDPLSAVDSHVGKHIFGEVIGPNGMLRNKTRIFVTNAISYLPKMDKIIVLRNGEISECGTYDELLDSQGAFADFIATYLQDVEGDDSNEDDEEKEVKAQLLRAISTMSNQDIDVFSDRGSEKTKSRKLARTASHRSGRSGKSGKTKATDTPSKADFEAQEIARKEKKLIQEESAMTGSVKLSVFLGYMKTYGVTTCVATFLFYLVLLAAQGFTNIWLSWWSTDKPTNGTALRDLRLGVYGGLGGLQAICTVGQALFIAVGSINASKILHNRLLKRLLRAPMSFFDTTPLGRIVNRCSRDVDVVDMNIPITIRIWSATFGSVITTIFVIAYSTPIFMAVLVPLSIFYYFVQRFYVNTSRQLKRIDSVRRSPIYNHFGESISGTSSIRAYNQVQRFIDISDNLTDENQMAYYPNIVSNRWLGVWLEFIGNLIVLFASIFAVVSRDSIDAGLVGLSVSYALQVTGALNMSVRMACDMENYVVAVERIQEYAECPQEAPAIVEGNRPSRHWPDRGSIEINEYSTRYRPGLDLVLKGISCQFNPQERIGIVGRTGAGKSSLTLALFRIIEKAGGNITIDGQNVANIGLTDLRSKLTIIPQDPVLFSGSLRMNLDPFERYTDDEIWRSLEHAHLKDFVSSLKEGLSFMCSEGGENLSVGQRQLVCLARALLRKTKVLVLDEATAAVDLETDDLIQSTIRSEFSTCTIITIAHRLNTILDYNRVMVLDKGQIAEFDAPGVLMSQKDSIFYGMAKDAGLISINNEHM